MQYPDSNRVRGDLFQTIFQGLAVKIREAQRGCEDFSLQGNMIHGMLMSISNDAATSRQLDKGDYR